QIDDIAWDACVTDSCQRIVYGYSWYLDVVLPAPAWKWVGLVLIDDAGTYQAVMPIPLRRKQIAGITYEWVVHQPFFCQFLSVFSRDVSVDPTPFLGIIQQNFRYCSIFACRHHIATFGERCTLSTQILDLSADYETLYQRYTSDRKLNLRRALRANWIVLESTDPTPLLNLFRENHANAIPNGVADWVYATFRILVNELNQRGMMTLRYALREGRIEAGALFVREGNRIIYLFNAASEAGRTGNARTLLIDQLIRENAGCRCVGKPTIFDFESPEKPSIRDFYRSFGAVEEPFWSIRWNRLNVVERLARQLRNVIKKASATH
ncbi:GNAT family N-acetyltransferase, partial [Spirosoma sp.]|uniref:GNAT family N-acetyltransferase n=1 Tax=Spirosoma sp. TaxID=1899569 RepID=UPI003B3B46E0